jgi:class 3 adenylate cyclase/DNA-binding transcriptional MerR regulator
LLTSKEIIERTGISRATLNNYIASGLVPRPQVLPPGPEHGDAPRIGFFPDDTIARIEAIQRLKREGWSIARISEHLAAHPPGQTPLPASTGAAAAPAPSPAPLEAPRHTFAAAAPSQPPLLTLPTHAAEPAYLVDGAFRILWANEAARTHALSPLAGIPAPDGQSVFAQLLRAPEADEGLLRFHLDAARVRSASTHELFASLPGEQAARLAKLYEQTKSDPRVLVLSAQLPDAGSAAARQAHAVQFREGVLFVYLPQRTAAAPVAAAAQRAPMAPTVTPVAVMVSSLHDAAGLWVKLSAQEYFELLNEVWTEVDRILRRHRGRTSRPAGELLVCYFLPQPDGAYLWNALSAAHQARDAMRQVSHRWQLRKGWDVELALDTGIAEGQEWMGAVGGAGEGELRVLGDAADHAEHLARTSRPGAILVTRSLVGKLDAPERERLSWGVSRPGGTRGDGPLLFTFARLQDIASPQPVPARFAELAVAELLDLASSPASTPRPGGAG